MSGSGSIAALIVSAGRGTRAPGGKPKQYRHLGGQPVLYWSASAFRNHPAVRDVRVVISDSDRALYEDAVAGLGFPAPVIGGATRQESVWNGLEALAATRPDYVLIHDGARPLVSAELISRVAAALNNSDAAIPLLPVTDTLRRTTGAGFELVDREGLRRAQTPQGFKFDAILAAHRKFKDINATDDVYLAEKFGLSLTEVAGEESNLKLTMESDFALAEKMTGNLLYDFRTGTGFDIHKFASGDHVWLCGIKVPHSSGLEGHSDADVGLHAATDAILGAIGAGDIGMHFPPSDPQWRNAPSHLFLTKASSLVAGRKGAIANIDITLICEAPKIAPHRDAMRERVAQILGIGINRVSVKATTTEGLGALGRREGIAAQASATVRLPVSGR
jgi:2-C-methyl-D-erythritol 4-phosphate cytidylyltransferase/2-C-methyl-D-erythritol 2,4-cyclodiphosphate synthase